MDFSPIPLDEDTLAFWRDVRTWFDEHVTDEILREEREEGAGFSQELHEALGRQGWIFPTWPPEDGGAGLDELRATIIDLELSAHRVPSRAGLGTTRLVIPAIDRWLDGDLRHELMLGAARGEIVFCLGYTEPDGGSDLAGVRTSAILDGSEWTVNGQKMFTTGAQDCDYSFLLARTNPDVSKHAGLTMFLVPLDVPGVEIQAVHTMSGERTNMVFLDDVRVADQYRVGPVDEGWMVLHGPLNREHAMDAAGPKPMEESPGEPGPTLSPLSDALSAAIQWARAPGVDGRRPLDDVQVRSRLAEIEQGVAVAEVTPGPPGRVLRSDLFIAHAAELMDLVGPQALASASFSDGSDYSDIEFAHRFAQGTAIYGGTTDVIRNLIAERFLGMPRSRPT
jgi:alkylation response protein AidB-like acyl-CoA dehydrogenase